MANRLFALVPSRGVFGRDAFAADTAQRVLQQPLGSPDVSEADVMPNVLAGTQHAVLPVSMHAEPLYRSLSLADAENWLAIGAGALLLIAGTSRRSARGACVAVSSLPLLYRGITGRWPDVLNGFAQPNSTRSALGGNRGVHVRESIRLEVPVGEVYRFWRRLEQLPQFNHMHKYMPLLLERIERGAIDPSFIITHRIGLEDAPAMYRTFRDKDDSCIKVVMKPGAATPRHTDPPSSREQ